MIAKDSAVRCGIFNKIAQTENDSSPVVGSILREYVTPRWGLGLQQLFSSNFSNRAVATQKSNRSSTLTPEDELETRYPRLLRNKANLRPMVGCNVTLLEPWVRLYRDSQSVI